jgi:hypothetical protein
VFEADPPKSLRKFQLTLGSKERSGILRVPNRIQSVTTGSQKRLEVVLGNSVFIGRCRSGSIHVPLFAPAPRWPPPPVLLNTAKVVLPREAVGLLSARSFVNGVEAA